MLRVLSGWSMNSLFAVIIACVYYLQVCDTEKDTL